MTEKHTPGPWIAKTSPGAGLGIWADLSPSLGADFSKDYPIYGFDAVPVPRFQISYEQWVQFPSAEFKAMQEANARLIAAAPELLNELIKARDTIYALQSSLAGPFFQDQLDKIEETIAKAIGQA